MKRFLSDLGFICFLAFAISVAPLSATPRWIWTSKNAKDGEHASFSKTFTLQGAVKSARLHFTCDNGAILFVNGKKITENSNWDAPTEVMIYSFLKPGENEIRFDAKNNGPIAGLIATLSIETDNGEKTLLETGADWRATASGSAESQPAVVVADYGDKPWGKALSPETIDNHELPDSTQIQVPTGFKAERIYSVPKEQQGSWVSLTQDTKGRLIACDQYGGLFRITLPASGSDAQAQVEPLLLPKGPSGEILGGAHGLLYAFDSLYLMVNEFKNKGLWRLRDTDGDDQFDQADYLIPFDIGSREHGVHSLVLAPDGKSIFFVNGNHTELPKNLSRNHLVATAEDHLIPRIWDPNGHAKDILAPGSYVAQTDPDGKNIQIFAGGFRNIYDVAFDANGELFGYDSDMEWDMGTPWYMPTRINHLVSGGDYGWRSGSGRWPDYYADSLPSTLDIGPGSPTGVIFGTGANFPAKYQRAMFALDWTFGTLWAIHHEPIGASFKSVKEEFVTGKPLPFTDALIRKQDGAMYFIIGGRKSQSALYRVSYSGSESTTPVAPIPPTAEAKLRHLLESDTPQALAQAWPNLASKDRFLRFAARSAIERQPVAQWAETALTQTEPQAVIEALIALARLGDKSFQPRIINALSRLDFAKLPKELRLPYLRAWQLTLIHMGKPTPEACEKIVQLLDSQFPTSDSLVNRELASILAYLDSPTLVAKIVPLLTTVIDSKIITTSEAILARSDTYSKAVEGMHNSHPNRQAIFYANVLREARIGWTPELRKNYFAWFPTTRSWNGGNSFRKFIETICNLALVNCVTDDSERSALKTLATTIPPTTSITVVAPKGPGQVYTSAGIVALAKANLKKRDFDHGKAMFSAALCINCHHFAGQGGNTGPDLTGAGNRYTIQDLSESITEPSKVISDQYPSEILTLKNGQNLSGRVVVEENNKLFVMTSALAPYALTTVADADIVSRKPNPVSMMPPAMINSLNPDEVLDLYAYILSGGNPQDSRF